MTNTQSKARILEQVVSWLHVQPGLEVQTNVRLPTTTDAARTREFDVLVTGAIGLYTTRIAIECKNYARAIKAPDIDAFAGKLDDVGIPRQQGIYVTPSRFTSGALARAAKDGIRTYVFSGLTESRLEIAVQSALQSVIYLLAHLGSVTIENDVPVAMSPLDTWMFYNDRQESRLLADVLWTQWTGRQIPSTVGAHAVDLTPPPGVYQMHEGRRVTLTSIRATVNVCAFVRQLQGQGHSAGLQDPSGSSPPHFKARGTFDRHHILPGLRVFTTEADLQEALGSIDVQYHVVVRQRLPRIRVGPIYWPMSKALVRRIVDKAAAEGVQSLDEALKRYDPKEHPELSIDAAFDAIVDGYTGGWLPSGMPYFGFTI